MEAAGSTETSTSFYLTARRRIPEDMLFTNAHTATVLPIGRSLLFTFCQLRVATMKLVEGEERADGKLTTSRIRSRRHPIFPRRLAVNL
jgi:hypothetical protein